MSKKYPNAKSIPSIILHCGMILAIMIIASALVSAIISMPVTLTTYKQFYLARETAMYGLVVALEALAGWFLTNRAITANSGEK